MDVRGDDLPFDEDEEAELPIEAPEADAAEQQRELSGDQRPPARWEPPLEADPADAADQNRTVDLDDDDYR
ncbi:hypothetical protein [Nonomuraea rhizosphaerae]|uniref:hypothetical protein n=1 Tax=Nonomuraea rhizosphaerae TaxID=2665663 RepID=UPI001C5F1051|nr:hypothetical protein [Nonomuraea rhizosphaerae]